MNIWNQREPREKLLIAIAAGLLLLILGGQFIMKPILAYPHTQKTAYEKAQANFEIMRDGQATLQSLPAKPKTQLKASQAQSKITKSAAEHGLVIARRQPNGDTGISLWFENAESTKLYAWLNTLTTEYNIQLSRVSIHRNDDGSIRAQLTLDMAL